MPVNSSGMPRDCNLGLLIEDKSAMTNPLIKIVDSDGNISSEAKLYLTNMHSRGGIVAFLGSGISIWHPSCIPTGQQITNKLAKIIAGTTVAPYQRILDLITKSAFEHIMERYPRRDVLANTLAKAFYPTLPNPVHKA